MGHHIDRNGRFQSDKYPELGPDKIVLSFQDPAALPALGLLALIHPDTELAEDITFRLRELLGYSRGVSA